MIVISESVSLSADVVAAWATIYLEAEEVLSHRLLRGLPHQQNPHQSGPLPEKEYDN